MAFKLKSNVVLSGLCGICVGVEMTLMLLLGFLQGGNAGKIEGVLVRLYGRFCPCVEVVRRSVCVDSWTSRGGRRESAVVVWT